MKNPTLTPELHKPHGDCNILCLNRCSNSISFVPFKNAFSEAYTWWKLREAIRVLNQTFSELRLEKHPDKTFIGRIGKGFDFLGYHFSPEGLSVAEKTIEKFLARAVRLYEQEQAFGFPLLGLYVRRWMSWVHCTVRFMPTPRHAAPYLLDVRTSG